MSLSILLKLNGKNKLTMKYYTIEHYISKDNKNSNPETILITLDEKEALREFNSCIEFCKVATDSRYVYTYQLFGWKDNRNKKLLGECNNKC